MVSLALRARSFACTGLFVFAAACSAAVSDPIANDPDVDVGSDALATVSLLPSADVGAWNVRGSPDATPLYRDVDDGTSSAQADDGASYVYTTPGATGSHRVAFDASAAPSGTVESVTVHFRASAGTGRGTAQVELYDDTTRIGTSDPHPLGSWALFSDPFTSLAVTSASRLRARIVLTNTAGAGSLRYTQIWITATFADPLANVRWACGTWALQEASSTTELDRLATSGALGTALAAPSLRGFSLRARWADVDRDLTLFERGRAIATSRGLAYAIRFMAGRSTPARVFDAGAYWYRLDTGERAPKPFSDTGVAGNPVFEREYEAMVASLASYARASGIRVLHLPWYGGKWAEINCGTDVGNAAGYSWEAWLEGHKRLFDIALRYAGPDLAIEFPMSGHWQAHPGGGSELASYMLSRTGSWSPRLLVQGNGLGEWTSKPTRLDIYHGMQMAYASSYDWADIYAFLESAPPSVSVEVYAGSFSLAGSAQLRSEIASFASSCSTRVR